MSIFTLGLRVTCDGCGKDGPKGFTAYSVRVAARGKGWLRVRGSTQDFCLECIAAGKMPPLPKKGGASDE